MNRKERRSLDSSKGGLDARVDRIRRAEHALQERIDNFETELLEQSKNFASITIRQELLPVVRKAVIEIFNPSTEDEIIQFELKFKELFEKRLLEIKSVRELSAEAVRNGNLESEGFNLD